MIVHTVRIQYKYGETVRFRMLSDVHLGSTNCDEKAAQRFINNAPDNCYFIGLGDLLDCIIASDAKRYKRSQVSDVGDDIIDSQIARMVAWLNPVKERIVGLLSGNHEMTILDRCGTNPTKRMCSELECKYLGYSAIVRIILSENNSRARTIVCRVHHGFGHGSRTQGADLTRFARDIAYWDVDVAVWGHVHRKQTDEVPRLGLSGDKIVSKPKLIGLAGSFLKTYSNDENCSYSERFGFAPIAVGGITLCVKPTNTWADLWWE